VRGGARVGDGLSRLVPGLRTGSTLRDAFLHSDPAEHVAGRVTTPITNAVIVMFENHTFANFFGDFPGANGVQSSPAPNPMAVDIDHSFPGYLVALSQGALNGFDPRGVVSYQQFDIAVLWEYANRFGLSDNFFTAAATSSTPNHLY
jgi:phospholipase C